ncbi:MAG: DUF4124 domain-containing protein [Pseudomonadota bacterium]
MKAIPILFGLLIFAVAGHAQTYRWIDENGVVSYSQTPPPSQEAETLNLKPQSQSDSAAANKKLDSLRQKLEDQREDRQLAKEEEEKAKQEKIRRQKNCVSARSNLRKMEGLGSRLLKTSDGKYTRLTEEERQKRIQAAKEQIKTDCSQ